MRSERNYEEMSTEELHEILRQDIDGEVELPIDTFLEICTIAAARTPAPHTPEEAWAQFCKYYLPEVLNEPEDEKIPESGRIPGSIFVGRSG